VYPCDFYVEAHLKLGNLMNQPLADLETAPSRSVFNSEKRLTSDACGICRYLSLCHGGCPRYRGLLAGDKRIPYFCESTRYFLDRNLEALEAITPSFHLDPNAQ